MPGAQEHTRLTRPRPRAPPRPATMSADRSARQSIQETRHESCHRRGQAQPHRQTDADQQRGFAQNHPQHSRPFCPPKLSGWRSHSAAARRCATSRRRVRRSRAMDSSTFIASVVNSIDASRSTAPIAAFTAAVKAAGSPAARAQIETRLRPPRGLLAPRHVHGGRNLFP
jgi:hypothetical protein